MSYKDFDDAITTIEKPQTSILDLIDERVKLNSTPKKTEIERETELFDNSHDDSNLRLVYNNMDKIAINKAKQEIKQDTSKLVNPFFGDSEVLNKMRTKRPQYRDVVNFDEEEPTLEINACDKCDTKVSKKSHTKLSRRKKMWLTTGICCGVLLTTLIVCNALSISRLDNAIQSSQSDLIRQEKVLDDLNGKISIESGTVPGGMQAGGTSITIDASAIRPVEITPSDNTFNRIAEFFAYIFGK